MDIDDLVALNAFEELPGYYVPWFDQKNTSRARRVCQVREIAVRSSLLEVSLATTRS
jgi:hypothetical protein